MNDVLTRPQRSIDCPSEVALERCATGEPLPEIQAHLAGCAQCQNYTRAVTRETERFLKARPPALFFEQLATRAAPQRRQTPWLLACGAVAAALVAVAGWQAQRVVALGVTMKGSANAVTVKRGSELWQLTVGEALSEGDALRFTVSRDTPGEAVVLMRDGAGRVQVVAPFDAAKAQVVKAGTTVLDDSAVLDASKGRHTVAIITGAEHIDVAHQVTLFKAGQPVGCQSCRVDLLTFEKR